MIRLLFITCFLPCLSFAQDFRPEPEISTGVETLSKTIGQNFMIVTANPLATQAGYDILKQGGSAADAAITAQLVLGLVEPQSSGLGGGAFALYYDAKSKQLTSWDGRETAPHSSKADMFLDNNGKPLPFWEAVIGPQSIGVPGTPKLLSALHRNFGKIHWSDLFSAPITIAEHGFKISPRLSKMIAADKGQLDRFKNTKNYFYTNDDILKNPDYASTLRLFKIMGSSVFYNPNLIGGHIIKATDGRINKDDLDGYRVIKRDPVCDHYHEYKICSMGEPSSGGLALLQILKLLEPFKLKQNDPATIHHIAEASKIAFSDRNMYMADPDFVTTPNVALLNDDYISQRRALITDRAKQYQAGDLSNIFSAMNTQPEEGTTHIVAVDKQGNAISMTSTIESAFGSKIMTNGFLLNNEMTDFSFLPEKDGKPVGNAIKPGKRPRSSMAPTIVFDKNGYPLLIIGSAGGSRIIGYVLHRLIAILDWEMDVDEALAMPSFLDRGNGLEMQPCHSEEVKPINNKAESLQCAQNDEIIDSLVQRNHDVKIKNLNSGLTAIHIKDSILNGAADPRREGIPMGE